MSNHPNRNPMLTHGGPRTESQRTLQLRACRFYIKAATGTDRYGNELTAFLATGGDTVAMLKFKFGGGIEIWRNRKYLCTMQTLHGVYDWCERHGKDW